jgi:predicted LPLAT superfamily acyltransferase
MSRQWAQLPERGTTAALGLIYWISMHLGRGVGRLLLYPIVFYFLLTAVAARRASRLYLQQVLERRPGYRDVFRHIYCFAATILDRVYLLAGQFERFDIRLHNGQLVLDQVGSGQGCILLGSHLGSFEVLRALGVTQGHFPLKILMNIDHNQTITRFINTLNPEIASTIIPIRGPETLLKVKESLEQGYLIGTLGDRVVASDKTIHCRFLGRQTCFPAGPMLLASIMKCPVILVFALYRGGNRYDVHFESLSDVITVDHQRRQEDIQYWTQRYVDRLEHYVRSAPYNWFNFYDYWQEDQA